MSLSARAGRIAVSPTMKVAADAMKMKAQGIDVDRFRGGGAGLSDARPTSAPPRTAPSTPTSRSTRTTPAPRISSAPSSSATRSTTASTTLPSEVICSAGGKQALFNSVLALFGPRRRSDHAHARLADAGRADQARRGDAGDRALEPGGRVRAARPTTILAAFTPRTRGIIINSPDNPTGAVISEGGARDRSRRRRRGAASGSCWISATTS